MAYVLFILSGFVFSMLIGSNSTPAGDERFLGCYMSEAAPAAEVTCNDSIIGKILNNFLNAHILIFFWIGFGFIALFSFSGDLIMDFISFLLGGLLFILLLSPFLYLIWFVFKGRHLTSHRTESLTSR